MQFRSDINGLRAYAVLPVVLFHFGIPGLQGGFVGVDVFFVISGFLMTSILLRKIDGNNLSILDFYKDRAKRIIPALLFLCSILLILGLFFLLPTELETLAKHITASLLFGSNIVYGTESGYFDRASHEKWLLHTWSLSAEWQFYILYPIALIIVLKLLGRRYIGRFLILTTLLSLVLSVFLTNKSPTHSYFQLPTRAWEMLAGALVAMYAVKFTENKAKILEITGLGLIIFSVIFVSESQPWPGYLALIPVVGAVFVLLASRTSSIFTSNYFVQFIGNISYSVYLWHWPLVVFLVYIEKSKVLSWQIAGIVSSIILGYLSYHFVEGYFRKKVIINDTRHTIFDDFFKNKVLLLLSATSIVSLLSLYIYFQEGFPHRVNELVRVADVETNNKSPLREKCFINQGVESPDCVFGNIDKKQVDIVYIGDSHALALLSGFVKALPDKKILFRGYSSCPTILGLNILERVDCKEYNFLTLKELSKYPQAKIVIVNLAPDFSKPNLEFYFDKPNVDRNTLKEQYKNAYIHTMCEFTKSNSVYVVKPVPVADGINIPSKVARSLFWRGEADSFVINKSDYFRRTELSLNVMYMAEKSCGIHLLDPTEYLCNERFCKTNVDGRPLYYDSHHMSEFGNQQLIPMFEKAFK